ncbi:MAG TPA: valine--tRNA ligase, partial [Candidatus Omnitrophota bacterium]|nr:valine--tRNA ligase [Candidatus Omnitrophota bacterium]
MELPSRYNPQETEDKWCKIWEDQHLFHAKVNPDKKPFTVVIPPPNVTGILHMGHALNNTLQDILVRYKRMKGFETLWMPGTDHAGIATQNVVEKQLAQEGKKRQDLGREEFLKRLWDWQKQCGGTIFHQLKKLGSSCDWDRTRFTMDEEYSDAVKLTFVKLFEKGLIYRGERIINWCPRCQSALSDEEAEHKEVKGALYHIYYPFKDNPNQSVVVATTRPETMLGDTAVAVNPKDTRYKKFIGKILVLPLMNREIKIIADDFVDSQFGSGAVKVTPAHDPNDFVMGKRHNLQFINILHPDGCLNSQAGRFAGLDRFIARKQIVESLKSSGNLEKIEEHIHAVGHCYRCHTILEPYLSKQWFVKMKPLAGPAIAVVKKGKIKFTPKRWTKVYLNWMENIQDWCISRQIWWGHRIPVWYCQNCPAENNIIVSTQTPPVCPRCHSKNLKQDEDVLDTWFSSWLWPFATLHWPGNKKELEYFYPTATLFTASEIIFFWVARMIMAGLEFMGDIPFSEVYIHGTVRDAKGQKMSKSLGNAIDPLKIIQEYGTDALRFSLIINSGQDIFISKEKFEIGRN